jgi:hypothetical protein
MTYPTSKLLLGAVLVCGLFLSGELLASGSVGGSAPRGRANKSYVMGKHVYLMKIACADCKAADGATSMEQAKALAVRIESDEFGLSAQERADALVYLSRRFKLK